MTKKYKNDLDGVNLMRTAFPVDTDPVALEKSLDSKKSIKAVAYNVFSKNYSMFGRVGLDREDIESILSCHAYVFFHKQPNAGPKILNSFLKQRALKLVGTYSTIAANMIESATDLTGIMAEDIGVDLSNPEEILLAKEKFSAMLKEVNENLIQKNQDLIRKLYMQVASTGASYDDVNGIAHRAALEYVSKLYRGETVNASNPKEFRKFLKNSFVKVFQDTGSKAVNG